MKIDYDPEADALYIDMRDVEVDSTIEIEEGVLFDYDADGNVVGIEILGFKVRQETRDLD